MALDKLTIINNGGLSTTSDYRVGVLTATKFVGPFEGTITSSDATFTGNVSIGGTLTYEDVTNIDSVGLVTARNGIDCNGDLDVDGHTNLDNVSIAGVTTTSDNIFIQADNRYLSIGAHSGGDLLAYHDGTKSVLVNYTGDFHIRSNNGSRSGLEGIILKPNGGTEIYHSGNKIIETDSLGVNVDGRLDVVGTGANDHLNVGTNTGRLRIGGYADLQLYHDSTNINYISNHNDIDLHITSTYGGSPVKTQAKFIHNGAVELYHNNFKTINTNTNGITLTAPEGGDCVLDMNADEGDDYPDKWRLNVTQGGSFQLKNFADGSWENHIQTTVNSSVQLYNNGNVKLETTSSGITVTGGITANANSAYSASIVFSDATGIRLSHSNQSDGNDGTIAAGSFASGLNIVGTRTLSSGNRQVRMWGDVFPSSNGAEKLGLSGNRWSKLYVNQILFNGDTASQNELDDYEEGTATFALHINGSEPSGISYSYNTAPYVKVGRMVYCAVSMFATSVPADTGSIDIQGLPFTDGGGGGYREPAFLAANHGGAGTYVISGALHGNNTKIRIRKNGNQDLDGSDIGSTFWMHGHITYKANV